FLQAEDGIRDFHVTGVQTCALPISDGDDVGVGVADFEAVTAVPVAVAALAPAGGFGERLGHLDAIPARAVAVAARAPDSGAQVNPGACHFGHPQPPSPSGRGTP